MSWDVRSLLGQSGDFEVVGAVVLDGAMGWLLLLGRLTQSAWPVRALLDPILSVLPVDPEVVESQLCQQDAW
jgi:hypothetical protein